MSKAEFLKQYNKDVKNITKCAKNLGLSEQKIKSIFKQCFVDSKSEIHSSKSAKKSTKAQKLRRTLGYIVLLFAILSVLIYILLNVHQTTSSIVLRNVQGLTYPTLKIVRFLSVPIIKIFPSLTALYDESCLVENPYFYVADMECWPCENVNAVLNITSVDDNLFKSGSGTPFVVKTNQKLVTFKHLQELYNNNKEILELEARSVKSTNSSITKIQDLFKYDLKLSSPSHISWRINKILPARIIRQAFAKPFFLPDRSGQAVERFVMIDAAKVKPYLLPNTECSYVFIVQGSGERTIVLKPSRECSSQCRTVSVVLKPGYVLWYNWWYWRPISLPTKNSSDTSITYINSYC